MIVSTKGLCGYIVRNSVLFCFSLSLWTLFRVQCLSFRGFTLICALKSQLTSGNHIGFLWVWVIPCFGGSCSPLGTWLWGNTASNRTFYPTSIFTRRVGLGMMTSSRSGVIMLGILGKTLVLGQNSYGLCKISSRILPPNHTVTLNVPKVKISLVITLGPALPVKPELSQ